MSSKNISEKNAGPKLLELFGGVRMVVRIDRACCSVLLHRSLLRNKHSAIGQTAFYKLT